MSSLWNFCYSEFEFKVLDFQIPFLNCFSPLSFFFFKKCLFIFSGSGERGRDRDRDRKRERAPRRFHPQCEARHRAWTHDHEIMTWAKIKSQMLNWLSHPGAPVSSFVLYGKRFFILLPMIWVRVLDSRWRKRTWRSTFHIKTLISSSSLQIKYLSPGIESESSLSNDLLRKDKGW